MCRGPLEKVVNEFVLMSITVSRMSCLSWMVLKMGTVGHTDTVLRDVAPRICSIYFVAF